MSCANELPLMSPLHATKLSSVKIWPSPPFPLESDDGANCKRGQLTIIHVSLIVMVLVALFCRSNIVEAGSFSVFFTLAVLFLAIALGVVCFTSIARLLTTLCISKKSNIKQFLMASSYLSNGYGNGIIAVALSSSSGFYLLARVAAGQCLDSDDIWKSQSCNPVALARSLPHDQVIICYLLPILVQLTVKGAKVQMAVFQWLIASIFVSICLVVVDGWLQIWTLIYSIFFLHITFEIEQFFVLICELRKDLRILSGLAPSLRTKGNILATLRPSLNAMNQGVNYLLRFEGILNHLSKEEHENLCSIIADCDVALSTFSNAIKQLTVDSKNITIVNNSSLTTRQQSLISIDMEMEEDNDLVTNSPRCMFSNFESYRGGNMMVLPDDCFPIEGSKAACGCTEFSTGPRRGPLEGVKRSYDRMNFDSLRHEVEVGLERGKYHVGDDDGELSLLDDIFQQALLQSLQDPSILTIRQPSQSFTLQPLSNEYNESLDSRTYRYEQNGLLLDDNSYFHSSGTDEHYASTVYQRRCKDSTESNTVKADPNSGYFADFRCNVMKEEDLLVSYDTAEFDVADSYDSSQLQQKSNLTPLQLYSFLPVNANARETITQFSILKPENTTILDLLELHSPLKPQAVRGHVSPLLVFPPARSDGHYNYPYQKSPNEFLNSKGTVFSRVASSMAISPPVGWTSSLDAVHWDHNCEEKSRSNECCAMESCTVDHPFWSDVVDTRSLRTAVVCGDEHIDEQQHIYNPRASMPKRLLDSQIRNNHGIPCNYEDIYGGSNRYAYDASESAAFQRSLVLSLIGGFQPIPVEIPKDLSQPASYLRKGRRRRWRSSLSHSQQIPQRDFSSFGAWERRELHVCVRLGLQEKIDPLSALSWDLLGIFEEDIATALEVYQLLLSSFSPVNHDPNIAHTSRYQKQMVDGFQGDDLDDMIKNLNATRVLVMKASVGLCLAIDNFTMMRNVRTFQNEK